jgi:hypothetical protein
MGDIEDTSGTPERIAEMEARLQRMEKNRSMSSRSRSFLSRIVPPEASRHFRAAGREQLMGVRALMDHWIHRLDEHESARPAEREEIPID